MQMKSVSRLLISGKHKHKNSIKTGIKEKSVCIQDLIIWDTAAFSQLLKALDTIHANGVKGSTSIIMHFYWL